MDQKVLNFIDTVNVNLKGATKTGEVLCIDELIVKAFHRGHNWMMKIIHKPWPIGNEFKLMSNASTRSVLQMELYEP